jgi:hypothetical protein
MKKIKVSEASNTQLDWLVAKCEQAVGAHIREGFNGELLVVDKHDFGAPANYCNDWSQMGPIIEREDASVVRCEDAYGKDKRGFTTSRRIPVWGAVIGQNSSGSIYGSQGDNWGDAYTLDEDALAYGPTPLIAAARCYVVFKLGNDVEVPEELV